jgi:hypothetical protein
MSARHPHTRRSRLRALAAASVLVVGLSLTGLGCRAATRAPIEVEAVSEAASAAFEEARSWDRGAGRLARERARKAAQRAHELAPDWAAPLRLLDDYRADDLLGIVALAEHRAILGRDPGNALEHYLAGRLEGSLGRGRFERAVELDPDLAWGHHGLGVMASVAGNRHAAVDHGQRALARARDGYERSHFTSMLARYHASNDEPRTAIEVLDERLNDPGIAPIDRDALSVQLAMIELSMVFQPEYRQGWARALDLIRTRDLTDDEIDRLVDRMRLLRSNDQSASLELQLALTQRPGVARDRWRATLMLEQRETSLALQLLNRARKSRPEASERDRPLLRAARFAASQFALGVEEWLGELPRVVLAEDELPRDPALRQIVLDARALGTDPGKDELVRFGEHLVAAGWFREARSVAAALGEYLDEGLRLEDQAAAGMGLIGEFKNLMEALDQRRAPRGPTLGSASGSAAPPLEAEATAAHYSATVRDLHGMLAAMAPAVARSQALLGGETDEERVFGVLLDSPMMEYASVGALVHPGPWYSVSDEEAGRGTAGEPVPGLAALLARLGRFGVFGQLSGGGGPDGTILQLVLAEDDGGEHLGVPWTGTIVWCEGADLKSRAGRMGADISGAALHEGYWVDIDAVRREHLPWVLVQRRFIGGADQNRLSQALLTRGLKLATAADDQQGRRRERRDATTLLGEADRMRLAVLRDRARQGVRGDLVTLDELLEVTAIHEEGHLCDRTRFLPLSRNLLSATRFLLSAGVSPSGVSRKLEYRAQLIAVCEAWDPRVPLVSVLRAAEGTGGGPTPHAAAYRELLSDLLSTLDRELERDPGAWSELDPDHVLAHQLHWLGPEKVRQLALLQARREGLYSR